MEQRGSGAQLGGCPTGAARMSTRPARPTCTRTKDQVPQDHVPSALQLHDLGARALGSSMTALNSVNPIILPEACSVHLAEMAAAVGAI